MILALLLSAVFAHADVKLPVVSMETFQPGRQFTWDYISTADGSIYSTERYTVLNQEPGGWVWIEMSTMLAGETGFKAHHRLHVPLNRCLEAYKNPVAYKPWSFEMYFLNNGKWEIYEPIAQASAFEEKFNCNPLYRESDRNFQYESKATEAGALFRLIKWRNIANSTWFHADGANAGTAAEKEFGNRFVFRARQ